MHASPTHFLKAPPHLRRFQQSTTAPQDRDDMPPPNKSRSMKPDTPQPSRPLMPRRRHILRAGLATAGLLAGRTLTAAASEPSDPGAGRPLRVAFLTDTHMPSDNPGAAERVGGLIQEIQNRPTPPDLFIFGGDNVMNVDARDVTEESVMTQFDLWTSQVADQLNTPSLSVIGNHDIWWNAPAEDGGDDHPSEKSLAIERFDMPHRYFSRVIGGWRFILLDCFHADGCKLDDEQWSWLERELAAGPEPVCLVSHAPILSVTHFFEPSTAIESGGYRVPANWAVKGATRFRELFRNHPHAKLALSGHMHTIDRAAADHMSYICGGAVSAAWWNGEYLGFGHLWVELLLHPDGTVEHTVHPWS